MTSKFQHLLKHYDELLADWDGKAVINDGFSPNQLPHVRWMIQQMLAPTEDRLQNKFDKATTLNRWLGFIQGYLWTVGLVTIEELRQQSKNLNDKE